MLAYYGHGPLVGYRHRSGALDQLLTWALHSLVWHEAGALLRRMGIGQGLCLVLVVAGVWLMRSGVRARGRR